MEFFDPRVSLLSFSRPSLIETKGNSIRIIIQFVIIGLIPLLFGCHDVSKKGQEWITDKNDGLPTSTLSEVGIQEEIIKEIVDSIKTGFYPNRHSLLIYKNDNLVLEEYFEGQDFIWGKDIGIIKHADTVLHDMRSVSKSVVSACMGLAIDQGKVAGTEQSVFDFFEDFEEYKSEGREALTIEHLLTMTSGLEWNEEVPYDHPENSEILMNNSGDVIGYVLSRKLKSEPGTEWRYNGGTTEVLAEIIRRVSGQDIHEFANEHLFQPLGITKSEWTLSPATNRPVAASGLRLTSRDMLKFGILYFNEGRWKENQVISSEWISKSLQPTIERPGNGGYGYQFWIFELEIGQKHLRLPAAVGNGDQRIFFDKQNQLLMVTTAGNYNQWDIENNAMAIFKKIYTSFL